MNTHFSARALLAFDEEGIWNLFNKYPLDTPITIEFDDVILPTRIPETLISHYFWELHKTYTETPLLSFHHLSSFKFTAGVVPQLFTRIIEDLYAVYGERTPLGDISRLIYRISNKLHNMVVLQLPEFVETMDARDYIAVLYNQDIDAAREECIRDGSPRAIRKLYSDIPAIVGHPDFLPTNALANTMRIKASSQGQLNQCVGIRGYVTDIDSTMFKHPIMDSFATGITDIADFIIESRSASKALLFQKDPIRETEYFNRRLQLLNQSITTIVKGDCGSTTYLNWHVQPGDLNALDGTYYVTENGTIDYINPNSKNSLSLIGKTIKIRSPIKCRHAHLGMVCEHCLGRLSFTLPHGTNIGHVAAYTMGEKITQAVLSVKHLDGSTEIKEISLDKTDLQYIRLSAQRNDLIKFVKDLAGYSDVKILLPVDGVINFAQAMATDNLSELSIYKISSLQQIGISYTHGDAESGMTIVDWATVSGPSRPSSLTVPFLKYIKRVGYTQDDARYIEVSLKDWDFDLPAFQLPPKQVNMLDFMKRFSDMLECGPKEGEKRRLDPNNPDDLVAYIRALFEYSSKHISIPIMYLQVTVLALLTRNADDGDYRLPEANGPVSFASAVSIMHYRSIGPALAYEEQANVLLNTKSFDRTNRVPHPMDSLFLPELNIPFYDANCPR